MTTTPAMPEPLGWYVVNNIGMATLCKDKAEAQLLAEDCDMVYQRQAPHRAVQLVALQAQPAEVSDVIAMVRERYRGTKWGKAAECICDAVDEAILALRPQAVPMTEADLLKCLIQANCLGTVHMSHEHGPYYVDRPSHAAVRLKDAIEAHHGITAQGGEG